MYAPPQLIDQFEVLWRDRIAPHVKYGGGISAELERLQSALRLPLPPDYVRLQQLIGNRSKHVFPHLSCSITDAERLTAELPSILAQMGFESGYMKDRALAFGETAYYVYFVDLATGLDDPMVFWFSRSRIGEGYVGRGSMMQVFLAHAEGRWG